MENRHLDQPYYSHNLPPVDSEYAILALHGRGRTPEEMLGLKDRADFGQASWIAPAAHNQTWYPNKFMDPVEKNEPYLSHAFECIRKRIETFISVGFSVDDIVIMGFSQGACLAAEFVYRYPDRYKAVICFTGGLIGEEGTDWIETGELNGTPILITTSKTDEWVPPSRVNESAERFRKINGRVTKIIYENREHIISDEELEKAMEIIQPS